MAEIGCLKDGYFNNLEVEKSFIHKKNSRNVYSGINASLTKYDCGIIFLNGTEDSASASLTSGVEMHLPSADTGLHYKFILNASMASGNGSFVISAPIDNASFVGSINASDTTINTSGAQSIVFNRGSLPGDFVDLNCYSDDGDIKRWHTFGNTGASGIHNVYFQ